MAWRRRERLATLLTAWALAVAIASTLMLLTAVDEKAGTPVAIVCVGGSCSQ